MASDDVSEKCGMRGAEAWQDYADAAASEVVGAIVALDINLPVNTNEEESINTSHVRRSMEEKIFLEMFGNTRGPHRRA